jgi:hypothetical protein
MYLGVSEEVFDDEKPMEIKHKALLLGHPASSTQPQARVMVDLPYQVTASREEPSQ